jgi:predicted ArsR family transcriptional regulator
VVFIGTDEQRTRERVLSAVSEHGPVTAAEVGRLLGLTPAAVRRHLDALADQSAVAPHEPGSGHSRGRGRPARAYVVAHGGHTSLPADYEGVASHALRYLEQTGGTAAVADFARHRMAGLESRYAARLAGDGDLAARTESLVAAMTEDGFAASARPVGAGSLTGIQLCQGHCPVARVAEEFPAFCDAETESISRLLGVHVQRLSTLAGGAHVCTTFVPTGALGSPRAGTPEPLPSLPLAVHASAPTASASTSSAPTPSAPTPSAPTPERAPR